MSDKEYYQLQTSISKALNPMEMPLKVKHARAAIISTFTNNGAHLFWQIALNQPIMENRIVAWKFSNLLHKILREGHGLCSEHSMRHRNWLKDLGKLFGHLSDGYGLCIFEYTKFLVIRIEFHDRNSRFPNNMQISKEEFQEVSSGDMDFNFQLAIEVFDYLDAIIALQATVYNSINSHRINSMTPSGQCVLTALIPCIQDSNALYDFAVRLMFKLHANIPHDLLIGHRQRFQTIFIQLKSFYKQSSNLQYFVNLITVPVLPISLPNFVSQIDLNQYITPVVVVPDVEVLPTPEPKIKEEIVLQQIEGNLIDPIQTPLQIPAPSNNDHLIKEKNDVIAQLQMEIQHLKTFINTKVSEFHEQSKKYEEEIELLKTDLIEKTDKIKILKDENDELIKNKLTVKLLKQSLDDEEEKAKQTEIKFTKLKEMYTQTRNEHVNLLRQHGEVNKRLEETTQEISDLLEVKDSLRLELNERSKVQETFQQASLDVTNEKYELIEKLQHLQEVNSLLHSENRELEAQKITELDKLNDYIEQLRSEIEEFKLATKNLVEEKTTLIEQNSKILQKKDEFEIKYNDSLVIVEENQREKCSLENQCEEIEKIKTAIITSLKQNLEDLQLEFDELKSTKNSLELNKQSLMENQEFTEKMKNEIETKYLNTTLIVDEQKNIIENCNKENIQLNQMLHENEQNKLGLTNQLKELQVLYDKLSEDYNELEIEKIRQEDEHKTINEENFTNSRVMIEGYNKKINEMTQQREKLVLENEESITEIEVIKTLLTEKFDENSKLKNDIIVITDKKNCEIKTLEMKLSETELKNEKLHGNIERLSIEKLTIENELQDLLHQQEQLEKTNNQLKNDIKVKQDEILVSKIHGETSVKTLLEACMKSSEIIATKTIKDFDDISSNPIGTSVHFMLMAEELQDILTQLIIVHENYLIDSNNVESLARKIIICGHLLSSVHVHGIHICNNSADIENGERTADAFKDWSLRITKLFEILVSSEKKSIKMGVTELKNKLENLIKMIGGLTNKPASSEQIGDMVEAELATMDKSIEEAAAKIEAMLSESRASDSGTKLEVNEKILDACTTLMKSIKILVQKSRLLQAEIVLLGKGTASEKEFYKRNHQWTEGLISAAKSVASGANFLVTAANKAVSGDAKHQFDLVVAAQDIAASTAQLVVSSRVKAPRGSLNLTALGTASRNVTQATGAVVATAKDSSKRLEDSQDSDLTSLTVHQAKTFEMNLQVKVLELEQALNNQRNRLYTFRKENYSATD